MDRDTEEVVQVRRPTAAPSRRFNRPSARYRHDITVLEETIYNDSPSQTANIPVFFTSTAGFLLVAIFYPWLIAHWHWMHILPKATGLILAGLCMLRAVLAYLGAACTQVEIDAERVTYTDGMLNRASFGVDLHRVQNVLLFQPWYERLFGVGSLLLETSDSQCKRLLLRGIHDVGSLRLAILKAAAASRERKGIREVQMGKI